MSRAPIEPPCPEVRFAPGFLRRVEAFAPRVAAARERREGAGAGRVDGGGHEFVGHRPYRPGEDLRHLDWDVLARAGRPFVRVLRRDAGEVWSLLVDASASMGVGPPGKLQAAAEVAVAAAAVGLRLGARVEVLAGAAPPVVLRRPGDIARLVERLASTRASGDRGLAPLLARTPRDAARVVALGDLADVAPRDVARLVRRGRLVAVGQVLAPVEWAPDAAGASVRWCDPEDGRRVDVVLDARTVDAYRSRLEARVEAWSERAARHRFVFHAWVAGRPFEDAARALLAV